MLLTMSSEPAKWNAVGNPTLRSWVVGKTFTFDNVAVWKFSTPNHTVLKNKTAKAFVYIKEMFYEEKSTRFKRW